MTNSDELPTSEIVARPPLRAANEHWFDYPVRAHPHHTDYAGIVWHGSYLQWMEEARVECLRSIGIDFADLVRLGCDLPVVELSIRYHRHIPMGAEVMVRTRIMEMSGVRVNWDYRIESLDGLELHASAMVTLVGIDRDKGKIMRQLPPAIEDALRKIQEG